MPESRDQIRLRNECQATRSCAQRGLEPVGLGNISRRLAADALECSKHLLIDDFRGRACQNELGGVFGMPRRIGLRHEPDE